MPSTIETEGSCLCGDVRYRFTAQPTYTCRCHCQDCKKASGSTNSVVLPISRSDLVFYDESALKQSKTIKHHASDVTLKVTFCGNCGSTIFKEASANPGVAIVFMGTIDDDGELIRQQPTAEIWTKFRVPWNVEVRGSKQCQEWDVPE